MRKTRQIGFTMIELLVVSTVIAILMAAGVVSYSKAGIKSRNSKRLSDLEQVRTALEMYRADNGIYYYPGTTSWTNVPTISSYLPVPPTDPKGTNYRYQVFNGSGTSYYSYRLNAALEGVTGCTGTCASCDTGYNYCVNNP